MQEEENMNKLFEMLLKNTSKAFCSNSNTLMIKFNYNVFPIHKVLLERDDNINALKEVTAKENNLQKEDIKINYIFPEEKQIIDFKIPIADEKKWQDSPW
jgi:uncharacterized protein (UPF0276 family)